jgi:hypothetical protein
LVVLKKVWFPLTKQFCFTVLRKTFWLYSMY